MAHLTNFSFEFFYEIFTEDASLLFLYHGAKKAGPLDLSFWSFLTFLHHGIEEIERHLL